jgi:hypothetical protein
MTRQAVACFRAQTYPAKRLLIWDTSARSEGSFLPEYFSGEDEETAWVSHDPAEAAQTIGGLRNEANSFWTEYPIIAHFDSDDYSHTERLAEQVELLEASGAEAVGYNSCLFWREDCACSVPERDCHDADCPAVNGEAWLYTSDYPGYCVGSSLMYWRATWERRHFDAKGPGEDTRFLQGVKSVSVLSIVEPYATELETEYRVELAAGNPRYEPRMVCRIHSGNTSPAYNRDVMLAVEKQGGEWKRVPAWTDYCRKAFA